MSSERGISGYLVGVILAGIVAWGLGKGALIPLYAALSWIYVLWITGVELLK